MQMRVFPVSHILKESELDTCKYCCYTLVPRKTDMEPKNEGLEDDSEDDSSFQRVFSGSMLIFGGVSHTVIPQYHAIPMFFHVEESSGSGVGQT